MDNNNILLACQNVTKSFGSSRAVCDFDIRIPSGKIVGLLGPNGSGKTTLIKMIAGLLLPTRGRILVDGAPIGEETKAVVSYLPDNGFFENWMTVNDCVALFEEFYTDFDKARTYEMLSLLGLKPNAPYKSLSKGNKEKVQLIMCMARRAKLYLLDEPIAGVDPAARDYILNTILTNFSRESTIIISTHLLADVEEVLDEFIFLREGRAVAYNSVSLSQEQTGKTLNELFKEVFRCY